VVDAGGGLMIDDSALTSAWIEATVPALVTDSDRLAAMGAAAAALIPHDADDRLAAIVVEAAGPGR
jgi:UDP-N-acetylglucosamine--N-acetylmuramyl-(pentapeptide) pyrophosphoryl-undecaprenol N-acetylglucosamine transferase